MDVEDGQLGPATLRALERAARPQTGRASDQASTSQADLARALRTADVPERYREASWDGVDVQEARSWQRGVLLHSYLRRGRGLMLLGPVGTGKSSIAACIARDTLQVGRGDETPVLHLGQPTVRWEYVPTMMDNLEKGDRIAVEERQYKPSLVVWDDFGVDKLADWQVGYLDRIVEWRYARRLSMVITSNVRPDDLKKDERLGRMLSRWRQMCDWLIVAGADRRVPEPA